MGLSSTLIYTSELILCSTICVPGATRHNIHIKKSTLLAYFYIRDPLFFPFVNRARDLPVRPSKIVAKSHGFCSLCRRFLIYLRTP